VSGGRGERQRSPGDSVALKGQGDDLFAVMFEREAFRAVLREVVTSRLRLFRNLGARA